MATYDGSSLFGWTITDPTRVYVDPTQGNPAPAFFVTGGDRAVMSVPSVNLAGDDFWYDIRIKSGTVPLAEFAIACSSTGAGVMLRIEARPGQSSGIIGTGSWTNFTSLVGTFVTAERVMPVNTWLRYHVKLRVSGGANQARVTRVATDGTEILCLDWTTFTPRGNYFGPVANTNGTSGAHYDNIVLGIPEIAVSGVAKLSSGAAATKVVFLDASLVLAKTIIPASDGTYSTTLPAGSYTVVAYGPDGYRPAAHLVAVS